VSQTAPSGQSSFVEHSTVVQPPSTQKSTKLRQSSRVLQLPPVSCLSSSSAAKLSSLPPEDAQVVNIMTVAKVKIAVNPERTSVLRIIISPFNDLHQVYFKLFAGAKFLLSTNPESAPDAMSAAKSIYKHFRLGHD